PHRFGIEIELLVPSAQDRAEILTVIRGASTEPNDFLLSRMSEQTHGYVGADLFALLQLSCRKARSRQLRNIASNNSSLRETGPDITDGENASNPNIS